VCRSMIGGTSVAVGCTSISGAVGRPVGGAQVVGGIPMSAGDAIGPVGRVGSDCECDRSDGLEGLRLPSWASLASCCSFGSVVIALPLSVPEFGLDATFRDRWSLSGRGGVGRSRRLRSGRRRRTDGRRF